MASLRFRDCPILVLDGKLDEKKARPLCRSNWLDQSPSMQKSLIPFYAA